MTQWNLLRARTPAAWGGALLLILAAGNPALATVPTGPLQGTFTLDVAQSDIDGAFCSPVISMEPLSGNGTAILSADGTTVSFEGTFSSSTAGSFSVADAIDVMTGTGTAVSDNSPAGSGAAFDVSVSSFVFSGDTFTFDLFLSQKPGTGEDCNSSGLLLHLVGSGMLVSSLESDGEVPLNVAATVTQSIISQQTGTQQFLANIGSRPGNALRAPASTAR